MKGIILAGGTGERLHPNTKVTNKHLLPVYDQPMIYYPLNTLLRGGIKDILIIIGPDHAGHFLNLLGSGSSFGCRLRYEIQEKPLGIAHALRLAEDFLDGEKCVVILGDNIFEDDISDNVREFEKGTVGTKLFLKAVKNPERFGVARLENGKVVEIIEKPKIPPSNLITVGLYMYDRKAFDVLKKIKPSARGEYEIEDINNWYIKNRDVSFTSLKGFWSDAGTTESLFEATQFIRERRLKGDSLGRPQIVNNKH